MKRISWLLALVFLLTCVAAAQEAAIMPQKIVNARFVYVTSYDGPEWWKNVMPDDRLAVADVQAALRDWGKYIVVLRPEYADIVVVVQKRPSEDTLAIYDRNPGMGSIPLWRAMREGGLDAKELALVDEFRKAVEKAK